MEVNTNRNLYTVYLKQSLTYIQSPLYLFCNPHCHKDYQRTAQLLNVLVNPTVVAQTVQKIREDLRYLDGRPLNYVSPNEDTNLVGVLKCLLLDSVP